MPNDGFNSSLLFVSTAGYARMNVTGSITSFVIASVHSSVRWNVCIKG